LNRQSDDGIATHSWVFDVDGHRISADVVVSTWDSVGRRRRLCEYVLRGGYPARPRTSNGDFGARTAHPRRQNADFTPISTLRSQ
jgi:hypothetical protein